MDRFGSRGHTAVDAYVRWISRHHRLVLGAAGLFAAIGIACATRLSLRSGIEELLPSGDEAAGALAESRRRVGDVSSLVVAIHSADPAANLAYAAALAPRIEALGPALVERSVYRAPEVRAFFEKNRWLYADPSLLRDLRDRLRFERETRKNPLYVALDEPPTLSALKARLGETREAVDRMPAGNLSTDGGRVVAIVVLPGTGKRRGSLDEGELERAVRGVIARTPPPLRSPNIEVRLAGEVHTQVAEREAIEKDVALTSVAVVLLVSLAVWLYFGRPRAIALMALPALWGAALALGFAGLAIGTLNASSAFLGGIIVGNGINYPILLLARYEEERARAGPFERASLPAPALANHAGIGTTRALARALASTARPTALAAFAASVSYGSLAITRFRGFSQFGIIGAVGMALCWLATMTILPSLLVLLDRDSGRDSGRGSEKVGGRALRRVNFGLPFARITARAPGALLAGLGIFTALVVAALPRWLADPYEWDFRHLRRLVVDDRPTESLDGLFGRALGPSVLLGDRPGDAREAKRVIRAQAARQTPNPVAHVVILDDLVPGSLSAQEERIALLDEIRDELSPERLTLLSPSQQEELGLFRPPPGLRPIATSDLPALALRPFRERDGTLGNVVLVYPPKDGYSTWNGHDLLRLAAAIHRVPLADGRVLHAAGRPVVFSSMLAAIAHDGPLATLASLSGVALLAIALLRRRHEVAWVLGALLLGVVWMLGVAAALGVKLNFLNFIALPITFGIGVDYAANVVLRYRGEGAGSTGRVLRSTGGAVVLNSATTTIGYAALLIAHNRALRSFGALAILGELACLSAAMLVLPSLLVLGDRARLRSQEVRS